MSEHHGRLVAPLATYWTTMERHANGGGVCFVDETPDYAGSKGEQRASRALIRQSIAGRRVAVRQGN